MRGALIRLLPLVLCLLPMAARAEGAVRVLECSLEKSCDGAGACEPASGEVVFSMAPRQLDPEGAGSYDISYGDVQAEMAAHSFAGPFTWDVDGETHTLLANSEIRFLWHRFSFEPQPGADLIFLGCEFTQ